MHIYYLIMFINGNSNDIVFVGIISKWYIKIMKQLILYMETVNIKQQTLVKVMKTTLCVCKK